VRGEERAKEKEEREKQVYAGGLLHVGMAWMQDRTAMVGLPCAMSGSCEMLNKLTRLPAAESGGEGGAGAAARREG